MNFEFVKVELSHPKIEKPLGQAWMIKMTDTETVMDYFLNKDSTLAEAFFDVSKVVEAKARGVKRHLTNRLACAVEQVQRDSESWISAISRIHHNRIDAILRNLPVYVNRNGGWTPVGDGCKEIETLVASRWPTDEEPRYIQWPNGTHWYAKVGANDVIVDGIQKWNSKDEAEAAYKEWMKKN
jgi:hypothetical protein